MSKQIPVLTDAQYLSRSAAVCPVCKSHNISSEDVDCNEGSGTSNCQCHTCGAYWTDMWRVTGFDNLNEGMSKKDLAVCEKKARKFLVDTFGEIK